MSKSRANIVDPWEVIDRFGPTPPMVFFTAKQPWTGYRFSVEHVGRGRATVPAPALETLRVLRLYANVTDGPGRRAAGDDLGPLGAVALAATTSGCASGGTPRRQFAGARSPSSWMTYPNWYVRRSERRFGRREGRPSHAAPLHSNGVADAGARPPPEPGHRGPSNGAGWRRPPSRVPEGAVERGDRTGWRGLHELAIARPAKWRRRRPAARAPARRRHRRDSAHGESSTAARKAGKVVRSHTGRRTR